MKKNKMLVLMLTVMTLFSFVVAASAETKTSGSYKDGFIVGYPVKNRIVPYPLTVLNWHSLEYKPNYGGSTINYLISQQNIGGVIRAGASGGYPFSQSIITSYVHWYKDGKYTQEWIFSKEGGGIIYEPGDSPFNFGYYTQRSLSSDYINRLDHFCGWHSEETIPSTKKVEGNSIQF